jgi:hypothetical protein
VSLPADPQNRAAAPRKSAKAAKAAPGSSTFVFVGRHEDVVQVLGGGDLDQAGKPAFSVAQYHQTGQRITRGQDFVAGADFDSPARARLLNILNRAWGALSAAVNIPQALAQSAGNRLDNALRRTSKAGRIDLIHDLAVQAAYGVQTDLFGTPGPAWLTELAAALPFSSQHMASLPPDWLAALAGDAPTDPGQTTVQIWSALILADMLGNVQSQHEAWPFSRQAGAEMLSHVDALLAAADAAAQAAAANGAPVPAPQKLVDAFAANAPAVAASDYGGDKDAYYRDAAVVLMELMVDCMAAVPATFGNILQFLLSHQIDLARLMPILHEPPPAGETLTGVQRLIYEAERLNPILPVLLRRCERTTVLQSGPTVTAGEWVAALVQAADVDPRAFGGQPLSFSLAPYLPGDRRDPDMYLMFGAPRPGVNRDTHYCWGAERLVMGVLEQCVEAAGLLQNLRPVAGPGRDQHRPARPLHADCVSSSRPEPADPAASRLRRRCDSSVRSACARLSCGEIACSS